MATERVESRELNNKYRLKLLRTGEIISVSERERVHFLRERSPYSYDWIVDLFCPAYRHERGSKGFVTKDRIECLCEAAGVEVSPPRFRLDADDLKIGRDWLEKHDLLDGKPVIGLQPYAQSPTRIWPITRWQTLSEILQLAGFHTVIFDSKKRRKVRSTTILGHYILGWDAGPLGALISLLDLMITPDSGLFHLSGAVRTRTLGLFCSTDGELTSRPYPTNTWLNPPGYERDRSRVFPYLRNGRAVAIQQCKAPCYSMRAKLTNRRLCWNVGCLYLAKLRAETVVERAIALLFSRRSPPMPLAKADEVGSKNI